MVPRHFYGQNSVSDRLWTKSIEHKPLFLTGLQNSRLGLNHYFVRLVRILSGFRPTFSPPLDETVLLVWADPAQRFCMFGYFRPVPVHRRVPAMFFYWLCRLFDSAGKYS